MQILNIQRNMRDFGVSYDCLTTTYGLNYILKKAESLQLPNELNFESIKDLGEPEINKLLKWLWKEEYNQANQKLVNLVTETQNQSKT